MSDTVHIIASPKPRCILLVREYRPFYGKYVWMIPSGRVDKEKDPLVGAQRELREETGYKAKKLRLYFKTRFVERMDYESYVFIAEDLIHDPLEKDDDEHMEVHSFLVSEAIEKVLSSDPIHNLSLSVLLKAERDGLFNS